MASFKRSLVHLALVILLLVSGSVPPVSAQAEPGDLVPAAYLPVVMNGPGCENKIPYQPGSHPEKEEETLRQINAQRAANGGLAPLEARYSLNQIARFHSLDMAVSGKTEHAGSAGETYPERFTWACETFAKKGEIIGWGFGGDVAGMLDWWMNHEPVAEDNIHRKTILSSSFTYVGVGYEEVEGSAYGSYWTVNFGGGLSANVLGAFTAEPHCFHETLILPDRGISATFCE